MDGAQNGVAAGRADRAASLAPRGQSGDGVPAGVARAVHGRCPGLGHDQRRCVGRIPRVREEPADAHGEPARPLPGTPAILTGDIHSSWVEDLVADPDAVLENALQSYPPAAQEAAETAAANGTATPASNPSPAPAAREGSPIPPMIAEPVPVPEQLSFVSDPAPAGVEFVCPSISSDGFYEIVRSVLQSPTVSVGAVKLAEAVLGAINPHLRWMDGIGHGFILIDVTEERVQADFHLTDEPSSSQPDPRVDPSHRPHHRVSFQTVAGSRVTSRGERPRGAPQRCAPPCGLPAGVRRTNRRHRTPPRPRPPHRPAVRRLPDRQRLPARLRRPEHRCPPALRHGHPRRNPRRSPRGRSHPRGRPDPHPPDHPHGRQRLRRTILAATLSRAGLRRRS